MKIKKKISALLTVIVTIGSITVFGTPADLGDTEYYKPVQALVDFQDKTPKVLPTEPSGQNFIQDYYLEEANGNRYYYAGRYADIASGWNAFAYKPASHTFDASGEYSMQSKIKLTQQSGSQIHLIFQATPGDKQYFTFEINGINSLDDVPEKSNFIIQWSGGSKTIPTSFSYPLKAETWYTFRNTYNLDDRSVKLEMYDAAGTELLATTGEIELPETVTSGTSEYTVPNPTSFRVIRGDFNQKTGGVGIDDFIIVKKTAIPLTVEYNEGGTVICGSQTAANGSILPIPYNSNGDIIITINSDEGHEIESVTLNDTPILQSVINLKGLKNKCKLSVQFKEKAITAPSLSGTPTYVKGEQGTTAYFVVSPGYGYTFTGGIAKIYEVGNVASENNPLILEPDETIINAMNLSWNGKYGIRVFGEALKEGNAYVLYPYLKATNGTDTVIIDPIENGADKKDYEFIK